MTTSSISFWSNLEIVKTGAPEAAAALEQLYLQIYRWASRHIASFRYHYPSGLTQDDALQSLMVKVLQGDCFHSMDRSQGSARAFIRTYARRHCWRLFPTPLPPTDPVDTVDVYAGASPEQQLQCKRRIEYIARRLLQLAENASDPMGFQLALEVALEFDRHEHLPPPVIERVLTAGLKIQAFHVRVSRFRTELHRIIEESNSPPINTPRAAAQSDKAKR